MLLAACFIFGLLTTEPQPGLPDGSSGRDTLSITAYGPRDTRDPQSVLLDLINAERSSLGLSPLKWDPRLAEAAHEHAEIMSHQGQLSHQFAGEPGLLERLTLHAVRLDAASENVVYDVSPEGAHEAFKKSLPHRANMLNASYDGVGIAVVNSKGILYVVEDFAHHIADLSDDQAGKKIAEHFAGLRQQYGLPPVEFVGDPQVQALVEQMAERQKPDGHAPLSLPGARFAASYATTSPDKMPVEVSHLAALRGANTCAVGVRFIRTAQYPSGLFWVSIVMFEESPKLAHR